MAAVFFDEEDDPKRRENPEGERVVGAHSGTNKKIKITEGTFLKRNRKKVSRGTGQNSQKSVPTTCTI